VVPTSPIKNPQSKIHNRDIRFCFDTEARIFPCRQGDSASKKTMPKMGPNHLTRNAQKPKFYVVWQGRRTGIFNSWEECSAQVTGFPGAKYKAFASRLEAERAFRGDYHKYAGKPASTEKWLFAPAPPILDSICVDAACSGSPGRLEYRGVITSTGSEFFREGPFQNGTNNVGEFLAIVHALRWLKRKKDARPLYSDSETAIQWVKKKSCNTTLVPDGHNAVLFERIGQAEAWLRKNKVENRLLKWDTRAWGEIPADFNRK
jgi:ribonuclease HI